MSGDEEQIPPPLGGLPPPPPPGSAPSAAAAPMPPPPAPSAPMPPPPPTEMPPPPAPSAPMPPPPAEMPPPPAPVADLPPPAPSAPMPPPPAEMPPPPAPVADLPPPAPVADLPPASLEPVGAPQSISDRIDLSSFRNSQSSSQNTDQMYGHIDRIASGSVGTLLDRFSNRFGSDLDREIIVLRKKEQQAMREVKPTVELLSAPGQNEEEDSENLVDDDSEFSTSELNGLKTRIENQIRPLKKRFDDAKSKRKTAEVRKLQPELKQMVEDRKIVIAALDGDFDSDEIEELLEEYSESEEIEVEIESDGSLSDEDNEDFVQFVELANELLGMMPSSFQSSFLAGDSFDFYKQVFDSPEDASEVDRSNFVDLINNELSSAPDEVLVRLRQDIDLARRVKERYG